MWELGRVCQKHTKGNGFCESSLNSHSVLMSPNRSKVAFHTVVHLRVGSGVEFGWLVHKLFSNLHIFSCIYTGYGLDSQVSRFVFKKI